MANRVPTTLIILTILFVGCFSVPIARQKRQVQPYGIERIENREWNFESDKFMRPIEEVPNRDHDIITERDLPVKATTKQQHDDKKVSARQKLEREEQMADYRDIIYSDEKDVHGPSNGKRRQRQLSPQQHDHRSSTIAPTEEQTSRKEVSESDVVDRMTESERNAERLFVQGINDKVEEQFAEKASDKPGVSDEIHELRNDSSLTIKLPFVPDEEPSESHIKVEEQRPEIKQNVRDIIAELTRRPQAPQPKLPSIVVTDNFDQTPTEGTPLDNTKAPVYAPRKPAWRPSHTVLRSSSEELSSLLENQNSSMEKDLVSQSESDKSASIVQRSPNDESDADGGMSDEKKDNEEASRFTTRSLDDVMALFSEENMSSVRNALTNYMESFMSMLAVSNVVSNMNSMQPLMNMISRFVTTN